MEIYLIPSDCRFSVWGKRIQLLVMVFIYYLLPLKPLPPRSNSDWQGWFLQILQGSQRSSFRRQRVPSHPLIRFRIARDISVPQIESVAICKPQQCVWKWRPKRSFSRAQYVDWEKQMRWLVKLIDQVWYNMETQSGTSSPERPSVTQRRTGVESCLFNTMLVVFD